MFLCSNWAFTLDQNDAEFDLSKGHALVISVFMNNKQTQCQVNPVLSPLSPSP